jgi:replication factor C large subunit
MRTARREIMPFLASMTHHCKNRELTVAMAATYEMGAEHVAFVTGSGKDTNKVQSIVEDAEQRRAEAAVEHSGGAFEGASASGAADAEPDEDTDSGAADDGDADATDQQVTLGGSTDGEADDTDEAADDATPDSEEADADDQQSGLSDFM